jgi:hypothetical protein
VPFNRRTSVSLFWIFRYGAPDLSDKVVNLKTGAARVATPKRREVLSFLPHAQSARWLRGRINHHKHAALASRGYAEAESIADRNQSYRLKRSESLGGYRMLATAATISQPMPAPPKIASAARMTVGMPVRTIRMSAAGLHLR